MSKLIFAERAWEEYLYWQETDSPENQKFYELSVVFGNYIKAFRALVQ
jgi:hypothetical protein